MTKIGKPFKPPRKNKKASWVKGVFVNGKFKQYQNRNVFDALGRVMGGISIVQAEKMGLLSPGEENKR